MADEPKLHSFLQGLSAAQVEALARIPRRRQFEPSEIILRQREVADRFYLVESGRVSLDSELPRQREVQIQQIGPGEALGWSWLNKPYKWQFTASAIDQMTVSAFPVEHLRDLCQRDPALGYTVMERAAQTLLERLQATRHKLRV